MRGPAVRPIMIAAGGTGGHVFPAEALAAALVSRGHRVALMTDARSASLGAFAGHERFVIRGAGIAGRGARRAALATLGIAAGVAQARGVLARTSASVVVGFGGYPSVAPVLAARLLRGGPAVVLHEQNAVLGRANRFLARRADLLALSVAGTARVPPGLARAVTGNPVRPAFAGIGRYVPPEMDFRVLVLGGSLGARVFSDVVPAAMAALPEALRARATIVQQCRAEDVERVRTAYAAAGIAADLGTFFPDVAWHLARAHLVIARAGASTVAELAVAGRPAILVPLPGAIDDHQAANARALADAGGAWVMPQAALSATALAAEIARVADPATLARASAAARTLGRADAADVLADAVERLAQRVAA